MSQVGDHRTGHADEEDPHSVTWPLHGLHLAVCSLSWTLILTLEPAV